MTVTNQLLAAISRKMPNMSLWDAIYLTIVTRKFSNKVFAKNNYRHFVIPVPLRAIKINRNILKTKTHPTTKTTRIYVQIVDHLHPRLKLQHCRKVVCLTDQTPIQGNAEMLKTEVVQ